MASPADLSLDYKPNNNYLLIQKTPGDQPVDQTEKIQDFVARLEEERLKIEAFKRELPLCMQLLNNALETCRQQLELCQTNQGSGPVLEEFIPLKNTGDTLTNSSSEKATWMVSAQLWSQANDAANSTQQQQQLISYNGATASVKEESSMVSPKLALNENKPMRNGGAFLPFSKNKANSVVAASKGLPELALASPEQKSFSEERISEENHEIARRDVANGSKNGGESTQAKQLSNSADGQASSQTHRKARRCWSPDLHRRFVNALQILGGSQVATPKQIRELMKVDGLTNDEVKSHLQKYRLHTRRPIPVPQPTSAATPQLVVLGGIWVPPEYATSATTAPIYAAHPGAPHYCTPAPVPPEFYAAHHPYHHLPAMIHRSIGGEQKGQASRSPESELRSEGGRSQSAEEEEGEDEEENVDEDCEEVVEDLEREKNVGV